MQDSVTETQIAPAYITQFLARFYNAVSTSGLRTLELMVKPRPPHSPRGSEPTLLALLAPLLPVRDPRSFRLTTISQLASIDDADVEALASAWPKVEQLFIHDGITPESTLSIRAIHHLYVRCTEPDLTELSISGLSFPIIGVHEIPAPLDRPVIHPLRFLDMRGQVILKTSVTSLVPHLSDEGTEATARYLLELFPCLDGRRYKREWDRSNPEVLGLLPDGLHFDER